jgi:hypothetical protein
MSFVQQYRSVLLFAGFLVLSSVLVVRQIAINEDHHVQLREAFILLYNKGYHPEAARLYQRLLADLETLPNRRLLEDFQRTLPLVDPLRDQPENLIWQYHWTVSNEMEKRSESTLQKALKLAEEKWP